MESSWFTVKRMKRFAYAILIMDAFLLLVWTGGGIYIITQLEHLCFEGQFIAHFLILIHFALTAYITTIIGEISKTQDAHRRRYEREMSPRPYVELQYLPYTFYFPVSWISIAIISFVGDVLLISAGSRLYVLREGVGDRCQASRLAHIIFDAVATLISLIAIVWFIVFTSYTIKRKIKTSCC